MINRQIKNIIKKFLYVDEGWHFGEGIKPALQAVRIALKITDAYLESNFNSIEAFLGIDGAIQINAYIDKESYIEAIVEPNLKISLDIMHNGKQVFEHYDMSVSQSIYTVYEWGRSWHTSDFFIQAGTVQSREGLQLFRLDQVPMAGYLSFPRSALIVQEPRYVPTSGDTTQESLDPHQSFSESTKMISLAGLSS